LAKITVIGIGHGGFAVASDMALAGHDVLFYVADRYVKRVKKLFEQKTITVTGVGRKGEAKLSSVTSSPEEAFKNDIIFAVIPAYSQEGFAREISRFMRKGHKLILAPGSTGGALVVGKIFHELNVDKNVIVSEMHTLPYACRKTGDISVEILLECKKLYFAAFPSKYNDEMFEMIKEFYPNVELVSDVLETALNNGNFISHPVPMVLNAGKIEYGEFPHYHYKHGITKSVARVIERIERERKSIIEALNYPYINSKDRLYLMDYGPKRETLYEIYKDSDVFNSLEGPYTLENRYLTEDIPYSLRAISSIGELIGIDTPYMNSIITIASGLMDKDYMEDGRKVSDMGIDSQKFEGIKKLLSEGY
jgi:opine dehydrogenase